ncbi:hypothetical protein FHR90_002817 [Endobacter medicaginis]|uniref:Uncharacterized protein n=1 Tax=Endobacter medicaginis TaxID=1181271 RepID=A0A839V365_9PROT|nr:hypothetical protein [Endobacter medicaginis]MBB3174970.1 hypothetical protein [Endobacter medicaginis]
MNVKLRHDSEIRELVAQQPVLGMVGVEAVDDLGHRCILSGAEPMFTGYELPKKFSTVLLRFDVSSRACRTRSSSRVILVGRFEAVRL